MNEREFVYWLRGFIVSEWCSVGERGNAKLTGISLTSTHVKEIQLELGKVIEKIESEPREDS